MRPSKRVILVMPVAPGIKPSDTSGKPNLMWGWFNANRAWATNANSQPPPKAAPSNNATTGLPSVSMRRNARLSFSNDSNAATESSGFKCCTPLRSAPAKNVVFADEKMTPLMRS